MIDNGKYLFLPWLRRGATTQIARVDGAASPAQSRASFKIDVSFEGSLSAGPVDLALYGPGDVIGFDARAVLRTSPAPNVFEAESNYFPLIEFDQPDLPWRYTAASAEQAKDRLKPWLCLIALKDDEFEFEDAAAHNRRLPAVLVPQKTPLPDLDESWAWAHAQIIGARGAGDVRQVVNLSTRQAISRIICPRRLDAKTPYTCFLVPVFERGRRAGLSEPQPDNLDVMLTSWNSDPSKRQPKLALPVYYHWRFQTGGEGDFESLVRKLTPRMLETTVGKRDMLVDDPGARLPSPVASAAVKVMALEGSLRPPDAGTSEWTERDRNEWINELTPLLNLSHDRLEKKDREKTITPPLYVRWHAAREKLEGTPDAQPKWFEELNIDPRLRVSAGLGALVVQDQREALLASAWQQVDRIRAINEELRLAQLARETAKSVKERSLDNANTDSVLTVTAPVHSMIGFKEATVSAHLEASPIPKGVLDPSWRRVARRLGPLGVRQRRDTDPPSSELLDRLNEGRLNAAPPPPPSPSLPIPPDRLRGNDGRLNQDEILSKPPGKDIPYEPDFVSDPLRWQWAPVELGFRQADPPPDIPLPGTVIKINTPPEKTEQKKVELDKIKEAILDALEPKNTIEEPLRKRLRKPAGWKPKDPIEPVMAYPEFPQPMYEPLRDMSQDWLFPGLDKIESNTLALLVPNQPGIEAYLAGLNHEMARALLFNEYPTDQRGSYFRQFWDVRGYATPATAKEFEDIKPLNEWSKTAHLGENGPRPPGESLVLLIRGELLQRYPNAIIYAVRATRDKPRKLSEKLEDEKHPVFFGKMKPDVVFVGFADLTAAKAKGSGADPGWFFVIQEQPSEPRFGLVAPEIPITGGARNPGELSWRHFAGSDADLKKLTYISFAASLPPIVDHGDARWPGPAASADPRASDIAFVTLRRPYRVAIHASEMLP